MKNWRRVILVSFILVGSTALFAYYLYRQFNTALDDLTVSNLIIVETSLSEKINKEQVPTSTPETISTSTLEIVSTSTPETISTSTSPSATSTGL